jgi:hypothetical protein
MEPQYLDDIEPEPEPEQEPENNNSMEDEFLNDVLNTGRFILSIGSKGSGKTYLMTAFLQYLLFNNVYQVYHFVCPCYEGEQNDSYNFLKGLNNVYIYKHYTEKVSIRVDKDRRKYKTCFLIDDATNELLQSNDKTFIHLITTTRHFKGCLLYVCVHSCKRILIPVVRQNVDYLFIYSMRNADLLKALYDEYFSMDFDKFIDFKLKFREATKEKYNAILYGSNTGIDYNINNWNIILNKDSYNIKKSKKVKKEDKKEDKKTIENKKENQKLNLFSIINNGFKYSRKRL